MPEVVRSRILAGMAVCDIGGGANALLSRDERETLGLVYTVIDVNPSELAKAQTMSARSSWTSRRSRLRTALTS